jgi:hypothetical protein
MQKAAERAALTELLSDIFEVKNLLAGAYIRFNCAMEPELVEANVYEINALQSRYSYLLRKIKEYEKKDVRSIRRSKKPEAAGLSKSG